MDNIKEEWYGVKQLIEWEDKRIKKLLMEVIYLYSLLHKNRHKYKRFRRTQRITENG